MKEEVEALQTNGGGMNKIDIKGEFEEILLPPVDSGSVELCEENGIENAVSDIERESFTHPNPKEDSHTSEYIKKLLEDWREDEDEDGEVGKATREPIEMKVCPISNLVCEESENLVTSIKQEILEDWVNKKEEDIKHEVIDEYDSFPCDDLVPVSNAVMNVDESTSVPSTEVKINLNETSEESDTNFPSSQENHLPETALHSSVVTTNIDSFIEQKHSIESTHFSKLSDEAVEESEVITIAQDLSCKTCSCYPSVSGSKKRKINLYDMLVKIDKHLDKNEDEFDMIGKRIASRLRKLPQETGLVAEKLINDIMFECEKGNVNVNTRLNVHQISQQSTLGPSCSYSTLNAGQCKKFSTQKETMCNIFSGPFN